VVDWIERIPFNETRNYVQRVLENVQIYRSVVAGRDEGVMLTADLRRGVSALVAPIEADASSPLLPIPRSRHGASRKRGAPGT